MNGIRHESIDVNELENSGTVQTVMEACMNLIHIHLTSAHKQSVFVAFLSTNSNHIKYYSKRTLKQKAEIDTILDNFSPVHWRRMGAVCAAPVHFEQAHKMWSREDSSLS